MTRIITAAGVLLVCVPTLAASADDPKAKADKSSTAAELYQALKREYDKTFKELIQIQQKIATIPKRMMELAEKSPGDPAAVDILLFVIQDPFVSQDPQFESLRAKALDLLAKHHVESTKIGSVCEVLVQAPDGEKLLRTIVAKNKHREVQGLSRLALAKFLKETSQQVENRAAAEKMAKEAEDLFDQVETRYAEIKHGDETLGDAAKPELFELRNLVIGKTAPDIEGRDSDDKKFKLSDYRGKVVVLDFWARW